jgi:hypothetical protein
MTASNCRIQQNCVELAPPSAGTMQGSFRGVMVEKAAEIRHRVEPIIILIRIESLLFACVFDIAVSTASRIVSVLG